MNNKLFLFLLSFLLSFSSFNYSFAIDSDNNISKTAKNNIVKKNNKTKTIKNNKNIRKSKKNNGIIRKSRNKKNNGIKALNEEQQVEDGAILLSNKTINIKSPLCVYAIKNDVISLKRNLMKHNYSNEEVNTICKDGETLLMLAVKNDNYLTVKFLLEKGANVNIQNDAGVAPLHILSRIDKQNTERIFNMFLLDQKLDKNIKDMEGYTPLMRAVEFDKIEIVEKLLKIGADVNVKNNYGFNAIELAQHKVEAQKSNEEKEKSERIVNILTKND